MAIIRKYKWIIMTLMVTRSERAGAREPGPPATAAAAATPAHRDCFIFHQWGIPLAITILRRHAGVRDAAQPGRTATSSLAMRTSRVMRSVRKSMDVLILSAVNAKHALDS